MLPRPNSEAPIGIFRKTSTKEILCSLEEGGKKDRVKGEEASQRARTEKK